MKQITHLHIRYQPFILVIILLGCIQLPAQSTKYNLAKLIKDNKYFPANRQPQALIGEEDNGITTHGNIWLKEISFSEGTIDLDLRGKDLFLKSYHTLPNQQ